MSIPEPDDALITSLALDNLAFYCKSAGVAKASDLNELQILEMLKRGASVA